LCLRQSGVEDRDRNLRRDRCRLSIASGFLWSKRLNIVATLRVLADRREQRQQNEPVPTIVTSNLRNVLRQSQPDVRFNPKAPAASRLRE
jgi:hypothetical protein